MRFVIQRVKKADVTVEGKSVGVIGPGLLIYVAFHCEDRFEIAEPLIRKICDLRLFPEGEKGFHLSLRESGSAVLLVSQFTLYADCRKGRRPSLNLAMAPDEARGFFDRFVTEFKRQFQGEVQTGSFGAHMEVSSINDGPVTMIIESESLLA